MKTLIKLLLMSGLILSLNCAAQEPGDSKPLASKTSMKGRKELKREKKIQKRSSKNAKKQERIAIKHSPLKHYTVGKHKKIRLRKQKNKEKGTTEEPKEKS